MVHGHDQTELIKFCICVGNMYLFCLAQQHIKIEPLNCIVLLLWRRKKHMIYATQAAKIENILIFFKLFSFYTCEYSFTHTITKMVDWAVQFDRSHAN